MCVEVDEAFVASISLAQVLGAHILHGCDADGERASGFRGRHRVSGYEVDVFA